MPDLTNKTTGLKLDATASAVDVLVQQIKEYIVENRLGLGDTLPSERNWAKGSMLRVTRSERPFASSRLMASSTSNPRLAP